MDGIQALNVVEKERLQDTTTIITDLLLADKELGINEKILDAIKDFSPPWVHASRIQKMTLPRILAGKNVIAQAKNGSGKTGAFGIAMLQTVSLPRSFR